MIYRPRTNGNGKNLFEVDFVTAAEFERGYAERSRMTVERLHALGRRAYPCRCDWEGCEGWQMLSEETAQSEVELGHITMEEYEKYGGVVPEPIIVQGSLPE